MKIKSKHFRANIIFNFIAIGLMSISFLIYHEFESSKKDIIKLKHKSDLIYVDNLTKNLSKDLIRIIGNNFYPTIKDDEILLEYITSNLNLFVTNKYHSISLIAKENHQDKNFKLLVGSSAEIGSKRTLGEECLPQCFNNLTKVFTTQKSLFFRNIDDTKEAGTYLYPIVSDDKVEAILKISFSMEDQKVLSDILSKLTETFEKSFLFFAFVFAFMLLFSYLDRQREQEKDKAQIKLEKSNIKLALMAKELQIETQKVQEFNETLKMRIEDEVDKNRQKDKKLMQQSRLAQMGEMLSMIAHQWRQPLTAISATSLSLQFKAELGNLDDKVVVERCKKISEYAQHLSETIDDFRDFFKPNKIKTRTSYQELITSVLSIVSASISNKNITITEDLQSQAVFVSYSNELMQVLLNLIKNADDILIEKETLNQEIIIKTYDSEEYAILEVHDNGGGIPNDILENIFDPYFSTKLEKNGTGLGLYMSKIIIEEHCGGLLTASNNPDGACFQIKLHKEET